MFTRLCAMDHSMAAINPGSELDPLALIAVAYDSWRKLSTLFTMQDYNRVSV